MSAALRFSGVVATVPGRITVPVRVPPDILAEAERIAGQLGEDRSVVLGDLVAAALPEALAEAADDLVGAPARERLAGSISSSDAKRPRLTAGACSDNLTATTVTPDPTGCGLDNEDASGGIAV